jgi:CDP-diacylglycerol--glycerol-3-phosphate 3-phosphatidyltransferase
MCKGIDTYKTTIIILFVVIWVTDLLDGYTARKFNKVSELGKIIDPIADKAAVITFSVIIFLVGGIYTWFFIIIVARDILILLFGLLLRAKYHLTLMSDYIGKITVTIIGIILLLSVINSELLNNQLRFVYYISVLFIIFSLLSYLKRFLETIKK